MISPDSNPITVSVQQNTTPPSSTTSSSTPASTTAKQIPSADSPTDFPDSNTENGNTMQCLEDALVDKYAEYADSKGIEFDKNKPSDRTRALEFMKPRITKLRGKPLKNGDKANSPVIADIHHISIQRKETRKEIDQRIREMLANNEPVTREDRKSREISVEKEVYKFHQTWEADISMPDGTTHTIQKTQWMVTGVEIPDDLGHSNHFELSKHTALLSLKAHRHILKAAFDPGHKEYAKVQECIQDLKCHDIIGYSGFIKENRMQFIATPTSEAEEDFNPSPQTIDARQHVQTTKVKLYDSRGKSVRILIDHSYNPEKKTARKLDEVGNRWIKSMPNQSGAMTHGQKLYDQAQEMDIRMPSTQHRLARHQNLLNAQTEEDVQSALGLNTTDSITPPETDSKKQLKQIADAKNNAKDRVKDVKDNFDREAKVLKAMVLAEAGVGIFSSKDPKTAMSELKAKGALPPQIQQQIHKVHGLQQELSKVDMTHKALKLQFQLLANQRTFSGRSLEFQNAFARTHSGLGENSRLVQKNANQLSIYTSAAAA